MRKNLWITCRNLTLVYRQVCVGVDFKRMSKDVITFLQPNVKRFEYKHVKSIAKRETKRPGVNWARFISGCRQTVLRAKQFHILDTTHIIGELRFLAINACWQTWVSKSCELSVLFSLLKL